MIEPVLPRILVIALLFASAICEGKDHRCQPAGDGQANSVLCENMGCVVRKLKPSRGFCVTGTGQVKTLDLEPGEQMCCTRTDAFKMYVGPDQRFVCSATDAVLFHTDAPEIRQEVDECMKGKQHPDECVPDFCCTAETCTWRIVNQREGEAIVCTATEVKVVRRAARSVPLVCTDHACYEAYVDPKEGEIACPRFRSAAPQEPGATEPAR
jgi:hypothetical protein